MHKRLESGRLFNEHPEGPMSLQIWSLAIKSVDLVIDISFTPLDTKVHMVKWQCWHTKGVEREPRRQERGCAGPTPSVLHKSFVSHDHSF